MERKQPRKWITVRQVDKAAGGKLWSLMLNERAPQHWDYHKTLSKSKGIKWILCWAFPWCAYRQRNTMLIILAAVVAQKGAFLHQSHRLKGTEEIAYIFFSFAVFVCRQMYVCLRVYIRICGGWKPNPCRPLENSTSSALRDLKSTSCFSVNSKDQPVSVSPPVIPGCHMGAGPYCGTASTLPTEPPLHSRNSVTVTALDTLSRVEINRPGHRHSEDVCKRFQPHYHPL